MKNTKRVQPKVLVEVSKVNGSKNCAVKLRKVKANYEACTAWQDINSVLSDPGFIADVPTEGNTVYALTPCEDSIDVVPTSTPIATTNSELCAMIENVVNLGWRIIMGMRCIFYNACGEGFSTLRSFADSCVWELNCQVDCLADTCVRYGTSIRVMDGLDSGNILSCIPCRPITLQEGMQAANILLDTWVDSLRCLSYSVPTEDVDTLNEWIRSWVRGKGYECKRSGM